MRKRVTILLTGTAIAVAVAHPAAAADDPDARHYGSTDSTQSTRWCETT